MNNYYTYAYLREDKTPYYIGKGQKDRLYRRHQKGISVPKNKSRIIFLKQNLTEEESFKHEIYMINVLGRKDLGTGILHNRTDGGEGASGLKHSEETKRKISEKTKDKMKNEEIRKKISETNTGRVRSEEFKKRVSETSRGRLHSEESKRKIGEASKNRKHSDESKKRMSESQKGILHTEETKRKMSESHNGKILSEKTKKKMSEVKTGNKHPNYNKKWWNNGSECKMSVECPGNNWNNGRLGTSS